MKKLYITILFGLLLFSVFVLAGRPDSTPSETITAGTKGNATVTIPAHAVELAPGVFYLGTANANGKLVEGYAFVDYKKNPVKPGTVCGNGVCDPGETVKKCPADCGGGIPDEDSTCYGFLSKGAKWKTVEPYVVNPENTAGLDMNFVFSNFESDIAKWENAAVTNIVGYGYTTADVLEADAVSPDNLNEIYFGSIAEPGAIAITIVWGIFGGPPKSRELVEWDQVYDQVDFQWSANGDANKMDFESIATHELGHTMGLDDLYTDGCSEQTMYGYASEGETNKRTLESGDIAGVRTLYAG